MLLVLRALYMTHECTRKRVELLFSTPRLRTSSGWISAPTRRELRRSWHRCSTIGIAYYTCDTGMLIARYTDASFHFEKLIGSPTPHCTSAAPLLLENFSKLNHKPLFTLRREQYASGQEMRHCAHVPPPLPRNSAAADQRIEPPLIPRYKLALAVFIVCFPSPTC